MRKPIHIPDWLKSRAKEIHANKQVVVYVAQLLAAFGKTKRSLNNNKTIAKALAACKLTTSPKFTAVGINEQIQIILRPKKLKTAPEVNRGSERSPIITYGMLKCVEMQRKLRHAGAEIAPRPNASYPKWFVKPREPLEAAVVILSQQDVDYVPVGESEDNFTTVISWDEVAIKDVQGMRRSKILCEQVKNQAIFVDESDSVYDSKNLIQKHGYVIVKNDKGRSFAIVRASDLAQELLALTESFLLLHEIENLIRMIIDTANPSQEEIDACIEERDRNKGITVDRMTFSNYCSLLRKGPEIFGKKLMRIKITKELSTQMAISLESIRETRNMIMHFHPDENDDGAKGRLSKARDFIRKFANEIEEYD